MPSIESKIISFFLSAINFKKLVERSLKQPPRSKQKLHNAREFKDFDPKEFLISKKVVITLTPKQCNNKQHILFFHGGAYVFEGSAMHRKLVTTFATKAACKVSYIDYPLAPESTYTETFEMVQQAYMVLLEKHPNDEFVFMGDSAGGGLALAFAQKLAFEKAKILPIKLVLFSPWIDLRMDNPDIVKLQKRDKILSVNGLKYTAFKYAGGENLNNYLLSPLYGNFENLCPAIVFYGSEEILFPDIELMKNKTGVSDIFTFQKFEGMQHDWVILPLPEAKEAIDKAVKFIN
jgi:acetyl esterase/lipase